MQPPNVVICGPIAKVDPSIFKLPIPNRLNFRNYESNPVDISEDSLFKDSGSTTIEPGTRATSINYFYLISRLCNCFVNGKKRNAVAQNPGSKYEVKNFSFDVPR